MGIFSFLDDKDILDDKLVYIYFYRSLTPKTSPHSILSWKKHKDSLKKKKKLYVHEVPRIFLEFMSHFLEKDTIKVIS